MKLTRFRLQRSHWFSGAVLVLLMVGLYRPSVTGNRSTAGQNRNYQEVTIYRVVSSDDDQSLQAFPAKLSPKVEPMAAAINLMTKLPASESPLPPGTRVLSVTMRDRGVAWADFNKAMVKNFPGGSLQESLAINSVVETLAQFPGVRAVQFTVEGKVVESIGGHEDVSEPQPVPESTASPSATATPYAVNR